MWYRKLALLAPMGLGLCAAAPPEGHQATLGAGYSDWGEPWSGFHAQEAVFVGGYSWRASDRGLTVAGEASTAVGQRNYDESVIPPWRSDFAGMAAVRLGWHWRYGGVEVGPAFWLDPTHMGPLPSIAWWAGHPYAYLWRRNCPGDGIGEIELVGPALGLGHSSEQVQAEVGVRGLIFGDPLIEARAAVQVGDGWWVGLQGRTPSDPDWTQDRRVLLTVATDPTRFAN